MKLCSFSHNVKGIVYMTYCLGLNLTADFKNQYFLRFCARYTCGKCNSLDSTSTY